MAGSNLRIRENPFPVRNRTPNPPSRKICILAVIPCEMLVVTSWCTPLSPILTSPITFDCLGDESFVQNGLVQPGFEPRNWPSPSYYVDAWRGSIWICYNLQKVSSSREFLSVRLESEILLDNIDKFRAGEVCWCRIPLHCTPSVFVSK
jgi:hypothetical protein